MPSYFQLGLDIPLVNSAQYEIIVSYPLNKTVLSNFKNTFHPEVQEECDISLQHIRNSLKPFIKSQEIYSKLIYKIITI